MKYTFRSLVVWLAVAATPVAGAPRLACVCPGEAKNCCQSKESAPASAKACCHKHVPAKPASNISAPHCQKVIVATTDALPAGPAHLPTDTVVAVSILAPDFDIASTFTLQVVFAPPTDPPPVDRIVLLCHFVI
jgi:hypothetical protein